MSDTTDPTQPSYYTDRAPAAEHQLRADFAHYHQARETYFADPTEENEQRFEDARTADGHWRHGPDPVASHKWQYLWDAVDDWKRAPGAMNRFHDQIQTDLADGYEGLSPDEWRSQQQARELTGHGIWEPETSSTTTASMNAFATAAAEQGHERDGADR